jgi:hypothetical protein
VLIHAATRAMATGYRETDLDNVLQIHLVFTNVSKGQTANKEEMLKCFKTEDLDTIILEILRKGEVQVGEKERANHNESALREIAQIVVDKTLNPETRKPYTRTIMEKAMADIHYSVHPTKNTKQQVRGLRNVRLGGIEAKARHRLSPHHSHPIEPLPLPSTPPMTGVRGHQGATGARHPPPRPSPDAHQDMHEVGGGAKGQGCALPTL